MLLCAHFHASYGFQSMVNARKDLAHAEKVTSKEDILVAVAARAEREPAGSRAPRH